MPVKVTNSRVNRILQVDNPVMATSMSEFRKKCNQNDSNGFILGIDIGTTTIKASLVNKTSKETIVREHVQHLAQVESEIAGHFKRHEQVVEQIFTALNKCLSGLPDVYMKYVKDIVVCGQMHGCVLWNKEKLFALEGLMEYLDMFQQTGNSVFSRLITWEDGRCTPDFLETLPKPSSGCPLASGFGCATLFWLERNAAEVFAKYDCAGTIMDLVVACVCRSNQVYISSHNACSWGYYDVKSQNWELDKLIPANFPTHLLPKVCEPGFIAGHLSQCWFGIPSGTIVRVALGDMQCSILANSPHSTDAVLNIGTSAQLSVVINENTKDFISKEMLSYPALNLAPYFNNCWLVVAASLTGGNAMSFLVKMLQDWINDLGLSQPSDQDIYEKLFDCSKLDKDCPKLTINPILWGERHNPNQTASVTNISPGSLSLGNVYNSLCHGVLVNIQSMMSTNFLEKCGVQKIIGTGNALVRNPTLPKGVQDVFNLQCVLCEDADASVGAALSAM